jgi:DNA-binding GntR family transcriptional regulator
MVNDIRVRSRGPAPSNVVIVAEALREALIKGRLAPGERIKEIPLAEQLGVSRGPIRDALRVLEQDGLVQILPNRGAIVPEVHGSDILEVYALRAALGSLALQKLLHAPANATGAKLEKSLRRFERAVARASAREAAEADLAFQSAIVDGAELPRVSREFERLTWQVKIFISTLDMRYEDKLEVMFDEVNALYQAIVARDAPGAEVLWREKFERWTRDFVNQLPDEEFDTELWVALTSGRR